MMALATVFSVAGALALTGCSPNSNTPSPQHSIRHARYHCPMHPTVTSDKPGDCPICGMKLVPIEPMDMVAVEPAAPTTGGLPGLAAVTIAPASRQRMGLTLGTVAKRPLRRDLRTSARILADETRLHHVTVKVEGWVGELFVAVTGQAVKHGDPLLTLYSPELVSAQEEYLIAAKAKESPGGASLLAAARRRLELWDVTADQITELEKTGQAPKYFTFRSHMSGVMLDRVVLPGHKVMPDETLMTIADLSVVWADADIYEADLALVKVGGPIAVTLPSWPGEVFSGQIIFVSPTVDPATRTLRARLEIPNPAGRLKPGMYADARLAFDLGDQLAIPEAAVMFTGEHTYAFRDAGDGRLVPTPLKLGPRSGEWFELVEGLKEGDRVVTSANFLVDSESNLKAALEGMEGAGEPGQ